MAMAKPKRAAPEIIMHEGKPKAVILDIERYQEMLKRLEDLDDLAMLKKLRAKTLQFRGLDDFRRESRRVV
jgi:PHD/YefM family antitoxin component YafN of YafNO toxin-antitoxin module